MIKHLQIASLLSLSLAAACAADTGSYNQDLTVTDVDEQSERCTRQLGDFDGTTTPPPITIPVGQEEISAQVAIEGAQNQPNDPRAGLLAEYATLIINIDAGIDLEPGEVDLLVLAEDLLVQSSDGALDPAIADTMVGTISQLDELNHQISIEVPCQQNADQQVLDTPSVETSSDRRDKAPATDTASTELSDGDDDASFDAPDTVTTFTPSDDDASFDAPDTMTVDSAQDDADFNAPQRFTGQ